MNPLDEPAAPRRAIPEMSIDVRLLCDRFRAAAPGEIVTDAQLAEIVGHDIWDGSSPQYSALRHVERNDGLVFARVRKTGYKRLDDAGLVAASQARIDRLRRAARKAARQLALVEDFDSLSEAQQIRHNAHASLVSMIAAVTRPAQISKLESRVAQARQSLPLAKTLEAFK